MSRYIDADEIKYSNFDVPILPAVFKNIAYKEDIDEISTADVEPVRHGHWFLEAKRSFNDYGDCRVYVVARCSNCGKYWHNGYSVRSETLLDCDYENEMPDQITEQKINYAKQRCLQDSKEIVKGYVSCELCGAKMDGEN